MPVRKHKPEFVEVDGHGRCEVLVVPKVAPAVERRHYVRDSMTHPAKMSVMLCRELIQRYTREGELVLDPMAGIGTTLVEAALLGRNAVGVELESKFVRISKRNIELLERFGARGRAEIIKGDARMLSELLAGRVDSIVFSPPYSEGIGHDSGDNADGRFKQRLEMQRRYTRSMASRGNIANLPHGQVDAVITSPPFAGQSGGKGERSRTPINRRYPGLFERCIGGNKGALSDHPAQIDNLPYRPDAIVFSPPFSSSEFDCRHGIKGPLSPNLRGRGAWEGRYKARLRADNIGRLNHGQIDAVITSPPFEEYNQYRGGTQDEQRMMGGSRPSPYSKNRKNIGNLGYGVDTIITSPPYSESMTKRRKGYTTCPQLSKTRNMGADSSDENIGNLSHGRINPLHSQVGTEKGETYLSAMLKVYRECFRVLKPGGRMVLVLKDFIRNKKIVRLDLDTKRLCEAVGFRWVETKLFKLPRQSFWRILYSRKHPDVDTSILNYEFVEVFEKPSGEGGGVDSVIFSPPYGDQNADRDMESSLRQLRRSGTTGVGKAARRGEFPFVVSKDNSNIANLPYHVNTVTTSPPCKTAGRRVPERTRG